MIYIIPAKYLISRLGSTKSGISHLDSTKSGISHLSSTKSGISHLDSTKSEISHLDSTKSGISHLDSTKSGISRLEWARYIKASFYISHLFTLYHNFVKFQYIYLIFFLHCDEKSVNALIIIHFICFFIFKNLY